VRPSTAFRIGGRKAGAVVDPTVQIGPPQVTPSSSRQVEIPPPNSKIPYYYVPRAVRELRAILHRQRSKLAPTLQHSTALRLPQVANPSPAAWVFNLTCPTLLLTNVRDRELHRSGLFPLHFSGREGTSERLGLCICHLEL
jgi:hypothetical protein